MNIVRASAVAAAIVCAGAVAPAAAAGSDTSPATTASSDDAALFQQARQAESAYRHRLARLRRLRELAQDEGAGERLAELDALYQRLHASRELKIERIRGRLDAAAHARLEAQLAEGRDRREWRQEARQQRFDERKGKRQEHLEQRRATRSERFDHRQAKRQEHVDQRQANRAERFDTRQGKRQEHAVQRQANRAERFANRQAVREDHFEQRQSKRAEAEARWIAAREEALAAAQARRAQRADEVEANVARWGTEARTKADSRRTDRWRKAANRRGVLTQRLLSQQEADAAVTAIITRANADAELQRLRREIESEK